ncbi:MAG: hypothetical protein CBB60_005125 [Armatimonadetes bacterium Cent15-Ar3]|nr:MAG: hypothetical protein CBB60_005125 [Armatimonadetes bacterium Cent15-Ar3]
MSRSFFIWESTSARVFTALFVVGWNPAVPGSGIGGGSGADAVSEDFTGSPDFGSPLAVGSVFDGSVFPGVGGVGAFASACEEVASAVAGAVVFDAPSSF